MVSGILMNWQTAKTHLRTILILGILTGTPGCQPARRVPVNQHILVSNRILEDDGEISTRELNTYIKQKPNKKIFGFYKFHLGLYNLANPVKKNKLNEGLRKIGEAPVIYDPAMTRKSVEQLTTHLTNKGYRNALVRDSMAINGKRAEVFYRIQFGQPYRIKSFEVGDSSLVADPWVLKTLLADASASLIKPGVRFDKDLLQDERKRVTGNLLNNGYYGFSRDYTYFSADTLQFPGEVVLKLGVENPRISVAQNQTLDYHPRYRLGKVSLFADYNATDYLRDPETYLNGTDTLPFNGLNLLYAKELPHRPALLWSSVQLREGELFRQRNVDETIQSLSSLRNFRQINITYQPQPAGPDSAGNLDCMILLTPETRQSYDVAVEGTYSSGNIGFAGNLIYKHRNLMKGAEYFELKFKGAVELLADAVADFNRMVELGVETKLEVPRTWIPFFSVGSLQGAKPNSSFTLSYNYQQRPDFTRTIANAGFGYRWRTGVKISHWLNLLEFNYIHVANLSDAFYNIIKGTYIENSFRSHVIPAFNYTFTLSNQDVDKDKSFYYLRFRPEIAGNSLTAVNRLLDRERPEDGYNLFRTPYSQYTLADVDFRYNLVVNPTNRFAFRFFAGAGYPYGNLDALPFEKKYFSGGGNGIRAWQVRSLGPGRYVLPEDQKKYYPNQLADLKLEMNLEYRFDLFWKLKGALFLDAGNIWALSEADEREGALFRTDRFYQEIAIGTGFGMRLDFSFLLVRLDLGVKVRDPGTPDGPQWIIGYRQYRLSDFVLNFGIGYPF